MKLLIPGFLILTIAAGCGRNAPSPVVSPDGSLTLVTFVEHSRADPRKHQCVAFEVRDRTGKVLHSENTGASDLSRWQMNWASTNRIRLVSSDIGTYYWSKQADGNQWIRSSGSINRLLFFNFRCLSTAFTGVILRPAWATLGSRAASFRKVFRHLDPSKRGNFGSTGGRRFSKRAGWEAIVRFLWFRSTHR
jgi:hypothetical protein